MQQLFRYIHELIEYEDALVVVLIDEVESLACVRSSSVGGAEPSDSIRAVNALPTYQLINLPTMTLGREL